MASEPVICLASDDRAMATLIGDLPWHGVAESYIEAVRHAGGCPVVIPIGNPEQGDRIVRGCHGVILTGGGDVCPELYSAAPHERVYGTSKGRDTVELQLLDTASSLGIPFLGICRSMQLANIWAGGTLCQDLGNSSIHWNIQNARAGVHGVRVAERSVLGRILQADSIQVNSLHHQALDKLGGGVRAVAWADDGVVEAIEFDGLPCMLFVQWHPELMPHEPRQQGLFSWLVERAVEYSASRSSAPWPIVDRSA